MTISPELGKALVGAFKDIKHATKNAKNPHFKNDYANLEEVLDVIKAAFARHELAVSQSPGKLIQEGDRFKVEIDTKIIHSSGSMYGYLSEMPVSPDKNGKITPHAVGSSISYGRRYALAAIAGITQADDDGNSGSSGQEDSDDEENDSLRSTIQDATTRGELRAIKSEVESSGNESLVEYFQARYKELKGT